MNIKIQISCLHRRSTIFSTALTCQSVVTPLKRGPFWEKYVSKFSIIGREVIMPSGQKAYWWWSYASFMCWVLIKSYLNRKDITLLISCVLWAQFKRSVPLVSTKSSIRIPQSGIELAWVLAGPKILKTINLFAVFGKAKTCQFFEFRKNPGFTWVKLLWKAEDWQWWGFPFLLL